MNGLADENDFVALCVLALWYGSDRWEAGWDDLAEHIVDYEREGWLDDQTRIEALRSKPIFLPSVWNPTMISC